MTVSNGPIGRVLALALLIGAVTLGVLYVVSPIRMAIAKTSADLQREQLLIAKLSARIETLSTLQPEDAPSLSDLPLWTGSSSGTGDAAIQAAIQRIISKRGLQPRAISAQSHPGLAGQQATKLLLQLRAPYDQAATLLQDIENHAPRLLIESLTMRAIRAGHQQSSQPIVDVRLEVIAPRVQPVVEAPQ